MNESRCANCGRRELALRERKVRRGPVYVLEWWCLACLNVPSI